VCAVCERVCVCVCVCMCVCAVCERGSVLSRVAACDSRGVYRLVCVCVCVFVCVFVCVCVCVSPIEGKRATASERNEQQKAALVSDKGSQRKVETL
jgi:hypothetical protein